MLSLEFDFWSTMRVTRITSERLSIDFWPIKNGDDDIEIVNRLGVSNQPTGFGLNP